MRTISKCSESSVGLSDTRENRGKMALHENLSDYVDRSSALIEESPQMDEQNTKRKVIEPLIEILGWDILSSDVELEYSVRMGSGTKKVDYALKIEDTPRVFVEAKGCDTTLTESHENQLRSYMRQVGVEWGLLSNGKEFEVFRRDYHSNRPNEISLAKFPLEKASENTYPIKALSKEFIKSGKSTRIAEQIEAVQRAVKNLRNNKESVAEEVTKVVTEVAGDAVSQSVEDEAKNFVDSLVSTLEEQAHQTGGATAGGGKVDDSGYVIRVLKNGSEIHRVSGTNQSESVKNLVDYLIKEESLLEEIEIPYIPGTGKGTRALINDEPVHSNGTEMKRYTTLSNGFVLMTNLNAEDKIRYVSELPEKVGLGCEFVGEW